MKLGIIPVLILALALAPALRADPVAAATAPPTPVSAPPTPVPAATPVPVATPVATNPPASGALGSGFSWAQVGWGALIVALIVGAVALIATQSKSSSGTSSGGGSTGY